jgi:hypothetical protein
MINRHKIEWHRKFFLAVVCLVLFFIGAPLGSIIRKGGLGWPLFYAVVFFILYHVCSIMGEKMAEMPNLPAISLDNIKQNTTLEQALNVWADTKIADKMLSDYALKKSLRKMPVEYEATMILTGIRLYSIDSIPQVSGLSSASKDACVVSFYREAVMRMVPVELAFYKNEKGIDQFGIYFVVPALHNFYFHYQLNKKDGNLLFVTSDQDARTKINALKADKRKGKNFEYEVSTNTALYQAFRQLLNKRL